MKLDDAAIKRVEEESRIQLSKIKISEEDADSFISQATSVLTDYQKRFSDTKEFKYRFIRRFGRVELILTIPGPRVNPFEEGDRGKERNIKKTIDSLLLTPSTEINYAYAGGNNIVYVHTPISQTEAKVLRSPMLYAVLLGIIGGLIIRVLPQEAASLITDEIAGPVLSVVTKILSGIIGPVIFLSLVTSINTLDSITQLNDLGIKIVRRFLHITDLTAIMAMLVACLFFPILGSGGTDFSPATVIDLFLSVVPTNVFTPFVDNNVPQIVVLGLIMGEALLIVGKKVSILPEILLDIKEWINELMFLVMKATPLVPFLSILRLIGQGRYDTMIRGWKYIVAIYICILLSFGIKLFKVSMRCKVSVPYLLKTVKPAGINSLVASNKATGITMCYDISDSMGIDKSYSNFWIPMNQAMLSTNYTIIFVLATFYVADLSGVPASPGFLIVLFILAVQLSMASPGMIGGLTILFQSLGLSTEYVGLFSVYKLLTSNALNMYNAVYRLLEEFEAATVMGKVNRANAFEYQPGGEHDSTAGGNTDAGGGKDVG